MQNIQIFYECPVVVTCFELNLSHVLHIKLLLIKNHVTLFSRYDETTFPLEFFFVFTPDIIGAILLKQYCQRWGIRKKYIKGVLSIEGGLNLLHTIHGNKVTF